MYTRIDSEGLSFMGFGTENVGYMVLIWYQGRNLVIRSAASGVKGVISGAPSSQSLDPEAVLHRKNTI